MGYLTGSSSKTESRRRLDFAGEALFDQGGDVARVVETGMREKKEFHISRDEGKGEIDLPSPLAGPLEESHSRRKV